MSKRTPPMTSTERARIVVERMAVIKAYPPFTLLRIGWEIKPGRVQGGIYYRIGDGLGPVPSDRTAIGVLSSVAESSFMPWADQQWGIEVLARPTHEAPR